LLIRVNGRALRSEFGLMFRDINTARAAGRAIEEQRLLNTIGTDLAKQIAVSTIPGDLGDQYNSYLDCKEIDRATRAQ
jgi:hypothetical protein